VAAASTGRSPAGADAPPGEGQPGRPARLLRRGQVRALGRLEVVIGLAFVIV